MSKPLPTLKKPTLAHALMTRMEEKGMGPMDLHRLTALSRGTISNALGLNKLSPNTAKLVCGALGLPTSREAIDQEYHVDEWLADRHKGGRSTMSLAEAIDDLEDADPEDRDRSLMDVFAAIRLERPSYLAVITTGQVPSPFNEELKELRDSLYSAHDRGLMVLFVVPTAAKVAQLRDYGLEAPDAESFTDGYKFYREGYMDLCQKKGDTEKYADRRMHMINHDVFDATQWNQIMCLIGEKTQYLNAPARAFERGPNSGRSVAVIPSNADHETGLKRYLKAVIRKAYPKDRPSFPDQFMKRLDGAGSPHTD